MNPLKQGLKLSIEVKEVNPLKQGLKRLSNKMMLDFQNFVKEVNPLKQGLKLFQEIFCICLILL